mgnify:CR=1 FL=1
MRQTDLDQEMIQMGKDRYWSKVRRTTENECETYAPVCKRLLGESIESLEQQIREWIKTSETGPGRRHTALPYIKLLPPDILAGLTARAVLDGISQQRTLTSISVRLGQYLEDEHRFRVIREEQPAYWHDLFERTKNHGGYTSKRRYIHKSAKAAGIVLPRWPGKESCAVGLVLVELMRVATGLIEIETMTNIFNRSVTMVRATEELLHWIKESHAYHEILQPVFLPMVVEPLPWQSIYIGGYHSDEVRRRPMVKTYDKAYLEELNSTDMPEVYQAISHLQNTAFEVNEDVYECMAYCFEHNHQIGDLPTNRDQEVPERPSDEDWLKEDVQKAWRQAARAVHSMNTKDRSRRLHLSKALYLSKKFLGRPIWFPIQLDFRGRKYPVPNYLSYQGPPWAQALLQFSKGKALENQDHANWLAWHAANCWGLDKKTHKERLEWAWSNEELFKKIHKDPLGYTQWREADDPWRFLAAAMDMGGFLEEGFGYVSKTPVGQDASNQGLQIYSMLLRDPEAAKYTNVLPGEFPYDLYQIVADRVVEKLETSDHEYAPKWLAFGVNRVATKRQTMTLPYGSTQQSCKEYTIEWFDHLVKRENKPNPFKGHPYRACIFLSSLIWESITELVTSATTGMSWLRGVASLCMDHGVSPMWTTPTGFLVKQLYEKQDSIEVKTSIGEKIRRHRLSVGRGEPSKRKNQNGICANFVHSLDGSLAEKTVNLSAINGIDQFVLIHDEYKVTAADSGTLASCVREATVDIFQHDLLAIFKQQIEYLLPSGVELPDIPYVGELDIEAVRESDYYFS